MAEMSINSKEIHIRMRSLLADADIEKYLPLLSLIWSYNDTNSGGMSMHVLPSNISRLRTVITVQTCFFE